MTDLLYWLLAAAALLGVWLNIHGYRACFLIWSATNASWCVVDFCHGIYAQAALQAVYFLLSLYGLWKWRDGACGRFERECERKETRSDEAQS